MSNFPIISLLETVLGKGRPSTNNNIAFNCLFCNHHKKKMEINIVSQHWHCWICNAAGRKLTSMLRRLGVDRAKISKLTILLEDIEYKPKITTTNTPVLSLPDGFRPLWVIDKGSPEFRNAIYYLRRRGISIYDILKYRIGYCDSGEYAGKIIIPSFDANSSLNYFVSRAYYSDDMQKHKNPAFSKDIIGFELHVNWNMPVVLVEGAFDAIAIRRNAIPLFGKTISDTLKRRIIEHGVKSIYICLDMDARKQALETAEYFMANGLHVYFVDLPEKDPSELGFLEIRKLIDETIELSSNKLMQEKILCRL